jgi:hypothetical protein
MAIARRNLFLMAFLSLEDGADAAARSRRLAALSVRFCELGHNARQTCHEAERRDCACWIGSDRIQSTTPSAMDTSRARRNAISP